MARAKMASNEVTQEQLSRIAETVQSDLRLADDQLETINRYPDLTAAPLREALAQRFGCTAALLKQRSPSCGKGEIYDGTFTGMLTPGDGVTAALLSAHGIRVYGEDDVAELLNL